MSERNKKFPTCPNGHTDETKRKISNTLKRKYEKGEIVMNHAKFTEERKKSILLSFQEKIILSVVKHTQKSLEIK